MDNSNEPRSIPAVSLKRNSLEPADNAGGWGRADGELLVGTTEGGRGLGVPKRLPQAPVKPGRTATRPHSRDAAAVLAYLAVSAGPAASVTPVDALSTTTPLAGTVEQRLGRSPKVAPACEGRARRDGRGKGTGRSGSRQPHARWPCASRFLRGTGTAVASHAAACCRAGSSLRLVAGASFVVGSLRLFQPHMQRCRAAYRR